MLWAVHCRRCLTSWPPARHRHPRSGRCCSAPAPPSALRCPRSLIALPVEEAAQLVPHLPPAHRQRLRTAALCLAHAQRATGAHLPQPVVWDILARVSGDCAFMTTTLSAHALTPIPACVSVLRFAAGRGLHPFPPVHANPCWLSFPFCPVVCFQPPRLAQPMFCST